jgi:hypothetical protein
MQKPKEDYVKDKKSGLRIPRLSFHSLNKKKYQQTFRYNKQNQVTETIKWDANGNIENKFIYNYDTNGNVKERILYSTNFSEKKPYINSHTFIYQSTVELIYYSNATSVNFKLQYFYDKDFKLIEKRRINDQGNLDWDILYSYNGFQLVMIELKNWDKTLNRKILYSYKNDLIEEKKLYDGNDKLLLKMEFKYDSKDNKIDQKLLNEKNEQTFRVSYEYLDKLIFKKVEFDNINEPKKLYQYDYTYY